MCRSLVMTRSFVPGLDSLFLEEVEFEGLVQLASAVFRLQGANLENGAHMQRTGPTGDGGGGV